MNILGICQSPEILQVMIYVKILLKGIIILAPILIIIKASIDIMKLISSENSDITKHIQQIFVTRFIACAIIVFMPNLINIVLDITGSRYGYEECIDLATSKQVESLYLTRAEKLVSSAEKSENRADLAQARNALNNVEDKTTKENLSKRLDIVETSIKKQEEERKETTSSGSPLTVGPGVGSAGNGKCQSGVYLSSEPDPSAPLKCWPNIISIKNFVFPVDKNGKKLGAYPKNYEKISTQLTKYTVYRDQFIIPVTPNNSKYNFVYEHTGIDFMAKFGEPIYSPVDGTLYYSEWGHTVNRGGDETAYSASIIPSVVVTVNGVKIDRVFLTHMSGIRYRCAPGKCNRKVKKGELIGFVGNAAGDATSPGWAPHLHMTLYNQSNYNGGLKTSKIEDLYKLKNGKKLTAGG